MMKQKREDFAIEIRRQTRMKDLNNLRKMRSENH